MQEIYTSPQEEYPILVRAEDRIRDTTSLHELTPQTERGETAEQCLERVFNIARDEAQAKAVFVEAGYGENEWKDNEGALLRVGLMTPHFVTSSARLSRLSSNEAPGFYDLLRNTVDYNKMLQQAIKLNPELDARSLAHFLQSNTMEADMPESLRNFSGSQINRVLNGARTEIIFEQILRTDTMKNSDITYLEASAEDDMNGIDLRAGVVFGKGRDRTVVEMPIDVKSTPKQVDMAAHSRNATFVKSGLYAIKDNAVVMWSGVDLNNLGSRLTIDPSTAEKKAEKTALLLRMAAGDYHTGVLKGFIQADLGRIAARVA